MEKEGLSRVPSRTPSRVPTRGGRGPGRKGPPRQPLASGTYLKGGAYRIIEVIGEGGFSITYLAAEGSRHLAVAIKELFPLGCRREGLEVLPDNHWDLKSFAAALDDFVREGKLLKIFNHPAIVQSYSPFEENGTAYLAMEYLQGESLLLGLQRRGMMNQEQAMEVARQVGGALRLVHDSSLIHSDIKPENIIHTDDNRFVLLDFGVSRRYMPGRTSKGAIVAVSPGYSPPEQYQASKALTPATDVYSLAATLYTMLTVTMPLDAISRQKGGHLPPLTVFNSTVDQYFSDAVEDALDLDPDSRPQTIADFLMRLESQEAGVGSYQQQAVVKSGPSTLQVEKVADFEAHRGAIYCLRIHPRQPLLLSGAKNGSVGLWSWPQGAPLGVLKAHDTALTGFAISPDGAFLATAGEPGEVKLWLMENGQMLRIMRTGWPPVHNLAFSADGQAVAVALADGTVNVFLPQRPEPLVLAGHVGVVNSVAFSPDGLMMASAGQDCMIHVWDLQTTTLFRTLTGHSRPVLHIDFSHDSKLLLSSSNDFSARVWEIAPGLELRRYREHTALVWSGAFTCDPDVVVTASADKKIRFFRLTTGREVFSADADKHHLRSVTCDRRYPVLASAGGDGRIRIWQFQT